MEGQAQPKLELCLERTGDPPYESGIICEPGTIVRFVVKSFYRAALRNPTLFTNYPRPGRGFDRQRFSALERVAYDGKQDWVSELNFEVPGTYDYYLVLSDGMESHRCKSGSIVVSTPVMVNNKPVMPHSMCAQTVLTRSLGTLDRWPRHFAKLRQLGYNAVHFTSLNELGYSRSAYAIRNQLSFAPTMFASGTAPTTEEMRKQVRATLASMEKDFGLLGIVDVVWNHTSSDSSWLGEHPDATYNVENSDHLKPALLLDEALQHFSQDVANGVYEHRGLGRNVGDETALTLVCQILENEIFPSLRLWEFFVVDVESAVQEFEAALESTEKHEPTTIFLGNEVECLKKNALSRGEAGWGRFTLKVDAAWAIKLFAPSAMRRIDWSKLPDKKAEYRDALNKVNLPLYEKLNEDLKAALSNLANRIRYERIDASGPRKTLVSAASPLFEPYFTKLINAKNSRPFYAANNGWVWGGNPTQNFADFPGSAYFKREIIIWADLIKLRYGTQPSDSPWLWGYMKEYTIENAQLFHGFRIDNCHSTPLPVARYMLDAARTQRPGLYVSAELFTGSERFDNLFVAKLGINSLIRESMQTKDAQELGSIIHKYGGDTIGSLVTRFPPSFYNSKQISHTPSSISLPTVHKNLLNTSQAAHKYPVSHTTATDWILPIQRSTPPAFLFDCTHDNQTPWQKRTGEDYLSNAALVSMARLPVASVAGYDWIVASNPHVDERRLYPTFAEDEMFGIMKARKFFNELHQRLEREGYTQIHIHQDGDLITIQRHNPNTHAAIYCVVHTAFHLGNQDNLTPTPVHIHGDITKFTFCGRLSFKNDDIQQFHEKFEAQANETKETRGNESGNSTPSPTATPSPSQSPTGKKWTTRQHSSSNDPNLIGGEACELLEVPLDRVVPDVLNVVSFDKHTIECVQELRWKDFRPGSVLVLEAQLYKSADEALTKLRSNLARPLRLGHLNQNDANYILFRCDAEERASSYGQRGVYNLPEYGDLVYAGLQGVVSVLDKIRLSDDMGHALCKNLRSGNWLMDYLVSRLEQCPCCTPPVSGGMSSSGSPSVGHSEGVSIVAAWLKAQFELVRQMPRFLIPRTFDLVVMKAYYSVKYHVANLASSALGGTPKAKFVLTSDEPLVQALAFTSIQLVGLLQTVSLLDPKISSDESRFRITMAAGLPHFAQGYMRSWGRDTFVAFRGLLLLTGRFDEAREILVGFAATLRHGLIPNLIDGGWNPRYNSRDATWWFLQALQAYCVMSPEGHSFLHDKCIPRLFKGDNDVVHLGAHLLNAETMVTMESVVQEIMERHANGIHFRERNAGTQIDSCMQDKGFNVDVALDLETGFVFGGNASNCGTWMDKMGSDHHAGNFGVPATPRDGAAIELVALLKSTVRWLSSISGSQLSAEPRASGSSSRSGSLKFNQHRPTSPALNKSNDSLSGSDSPSNRSRSGSSSSSNPSPNSIHHVVHPATTSTSGTTNASTTTSSTLTPATASKAPANANTTLQAQPKASPDNFSFSSALRVATPPVPESPPIGTYSELSPDPTTGLHSSDGNHDKLKFSAPPEVLPELKEPFNLPPPLFGSGSSKSKLPLDSHSPHASSSSSASAAAEAHADSTTKSTGLEDFLQRKKSTIAVPNLVQLPDVVQVLASESKFAFQGVTIKKDDGTSTFLSYADWDARIKLNFEKCFFVPRDVREDSAYRVQRQYIARRSVYKDSYKSSGKSTDYQLRPNMCIAMVVAPELFVPEHASDALDQVEKHLLGPLGMRTLDPGDGKYRGFYDNGNHSDDYYMAGGFSYHMGPEWVWLLGYFLRARLQFRSKPSTVVLNQIQRIIQVHRETLDSSDWKGLPELTNKDGAPCPGSCHNQAWSSACLLEALYDLHNY